MDGGALREVEQRLRELENQVRPRGTVYVVMGNDFPEAVFSQYKEVAAFVDRRIRECPDVRWRSYQFEINEGVR